MSGQQPPYRVSIPDPKMNKHLKPDPVIPGQEWCVLAFISPDDLAAKRELYLMDHFLHETANEYLKATSQHMSRAINAKLQKQFEVQVTRFRKSKNEYHRLMADLMDKIRREEIQIDEDEFATECLHEHYQGLDDLKASFDDFKVRRRPELDPKFSAQHQNRPSVRGVKFGGAYATRQEAEERAEELTALEGYVHRFVPMSFHWIEFDPDINAIPEQKTGHAQLDELLRARKAEQKNIDKHFQEDKRNRMEAAKAENEERKELQRKYASQAQELPVNQLPKTFSTDQQETDNDEPSYQVEETEANLGGFSVEEIMAQAKKQNQDLQKRLREKYSSSSEPSQSSDSSQKKKRKKHK